MPKEPTKKPAAKKTPATKPVAKKAPEKKTASRATPARKPAARRATTRRPSHEEIAFRAYVLSLEGHGDELANWLRAERELTTA